MNRAYPRRVVLGVSGASADELPLTWALDECRTTAAQLVVAHACSRAADEGHEPGSRHLHPGMATSLERARQVLGDDAVTLVVQPPPPGIMLTGLATPTDLLVVGPPTVGRWTHWGSTTHYLTQHAPCPVVVARPVSPDPHRPFADHVVIGVDGSAAAQSATAFAFAYAEKHGLPVVGVTVSASGSRDFWSDDQFHEPQIEAEPAACELLARELPPWQRVYPAVRVRRAVFAGPAADGLIRAARGARLLVVGAHTALGLRALLGSTSLDLIGRATCPVAVRQPPTSTTGQSPTCKEVHDVRA